MSRQPPAPKRLVFDHALLPAGRAADVAIDIEDDVITAVVPEARDGGQKNVGERVSERVRGLALPGLPNLHSHAFQRAMAGLAETRGPDTDNFWTWRKVMYRFLEGLTPEDVEAIAGYAYMEMLEAGFTAVGEFHYLHHDPTGVPYADLSEMSGRIVAAAAETGIGLTLLPCFYANGNFGGAAPLAGQRRFVNAPDRFKKLLEGAGRDIQSLADARLGIAPHSLRAVTPATLGEVVCMSREGPIHIHAAEQMKEVEDCLASLRLRPVEWLLHHHEIGPRWCLVHATHMTSAEATALAGSGAVVGLCPITEANLGDGAFDGPRWCEAAGRFGVGTDSNIEITASGELKQLEYAQRLFRRARNVLAPREGLSSGSWLYEQALAGGAQALGRRIGSLAPGCRADIVVLDPDDPDLCTAPLARWLDVLVFVAGPRAVRDVYVGGTRMVEGGAHLRREELTARYHATMRRLASG